MCGVFALKIIVSTQLHQCTQSVSVLIIRVIREIHADYVATDCCQAERIKKKTIANESRRTKGMLTRRVQE